MEENKIYRVNQYCQNKNNNVSDANNTTYMSRIDAGSARTRSNIINGNLDTCVCLGSTFLEGGKIYYFHSQIKQSTVAKKYEVFLVKYDDYSTEQYLGSITVPSGIGTVHFECTFTPLQTDGPFFNTIVFKTSDSDSIILFQELYLVNNIITSAIDGDSLYKNFVKMGIQADYKTRFCINGELIMVGKSNIYEIYNENIRVYSFSYISPCLENSSFTESTCVFNQPKTRNIAAFIVDYMYED